MFLKPLTYLKDFRDYLKNTLEGNLNIKKTASDTLASLSLSTVEDDKFYGEYAEEAFRLFLDKRRKERKSGGTKS